MAHHQIKQEAAELRADVAGFEQDASTSKSRVMAIAEFDRLLDAIARRPGTLTAELIDPHHAIVAAGGDSSKDRTVATDPLVNGALKRGSSYAGREADATRDGDNFEFVFPVVLPGGRYAYVVRYGHREYDAQLHSVQLVLLFVGLVMLFGGGGVFYLAGGRRLLRDHRVALERATRDGLTDLPNQRAFQDELPQEVDAAHRYEHSVALTLLDVDDFKHINDQHGHPHGDDVLNRVAAVLRDGRAGDRAYRIGGDEFALLLAHTDAAGAQVLTQRLHHRFQDAGLKVSIGVSALRPGQQIDTLRAEADAALYESKRLGGNRNVSFDEIRDQITVTTAGQKDAVRRLIDEAALSTVFQTIWDFKTGELLGIEALARPDERLNLAGPAEAFDIAEQIGRAHDLDVLCARTALRSAPHLEPGVLLFVNLTPQTLDLDAGGNDWFLREVAGVGLAPEQIVVEVTERFGGRIAAVVKCLERLREQGFKTAIDDVGTGNSGLEILRKTATEFVKIDRSIVAAAPSDPNARGVLMAMATFARLTGAYVIAEGIEDDETLRFLLSIDDSDLQIDTIIGGGQGYELGRPATDVPTTPPDALTPAHVATARRDE
jgi:diguanylate cyclase (GGDEF)-like protein